MAIVSTRMINPLFGARLCSCF